MKKIYSLFLLLGLLLSVGTAWAETKTDVLTTSTFGSPSSYTTWSGKKATGGSDAVYMGNSTTNNSSNIQIRSTSPSGIMTTTSGGKVKSVTVVWASNTATGRTLDIYGKNSAYTAAADLYSSSSATVGTKLGSIVCGTSTSLTINGDYEYIGMRSNSGAMYLTSITVVWETGGTLPSISADNVDVAYDATAGSIAYTVNNSVTGGAISAEVTEGDWLTLGQSFTSPIAFTCVANPSASARTAIVKLTYTYNTSETVIKNVIVTQAADPNALINISTITGSGMGFNIKGTIVAISARGFVIGDGTGYAYYYGGSSFTTTHVIGDVVRISGTTNSYNKVIQLPDASTISDATNSGYDNTPAIQVLDHEGIEAYSAGPYLSDYVQVEGKLVKSGDYYNLQVTDLATDASISYPTADQKTALNSLLNKQVIVKGYFGGVSSSHFNIILESIEEKVIIIPAINLSATSINATAAEKTGTIDVTYDNITDIDAEVHFFESDGTTPATYNWIEADINNENNLYYVIGANTGAARTAYMKVYTLDDSGDDVYSALITVSQERYISDYVTLPLSYNGGKDNLPDGFTATGLGSDYNPSTAPTTQLKFDSSGDNIIIRMNEPAGVLSFDIKGNSFSSGLFRVQTSADGVQYSDLKVYQDLGETQTERFAIAANVRYIKWIYENKSAGNVGLGNIKLDKPVTLGANGYSTYAADFKYSVSGATVYIAAVNDAKDVITLTAVADAVVPAGAGIVLKGTEGETVTITPSSATASNLEGNELIGVATTPTLAPANAYVLSTFEDGTKFNPCDANTTIFIPIHKAYLVIEGAPSQAPIRIIENATGIMNVNDVENAVKYIENGKLFIKKNGVVYDVMGTVVK